MNVLVVDTSVWVSYFRMRAFEGEDDLELALREGRVLLPPIVGAELLSGAKDSKDQDRLSDFLKQLQLCVCDIDHWLRVGLLRSRLAQSGIAISTPDAHIAQCALDVNGFLFSEDSIFEKIRRRTGLRLAAKAGHSA